MSGENNEDVAFDAAVKTLDKVAGQNGSASDDDTVTLTSGVVLRMKGVNPLVIQAASGNVKEPEVPLAHIPDEDKWVPNPSNPDYIKAMAKFRQDQYLAIIDAGYLMSIEIVHVPDDVCDMDNDEWMEQLAFLKVIDPEQIRSSKHARKLAWLKYYVVSDDSDYPKLTNAVMRKAGLLEGDVQEAVKTFPNREERRANRKSRT